MGRSRKPLTGQPVRGFESHPLRHSLSSRWKRAVLDARAPSDLLYGFRSARRAGPEGPAIPRIMTPTWKKAVLRETDFSAQQPAPQADARIPGADAHPPRPGSDRPAAPEGTQAPERLMPDEERLPRSTPGATQRLPAEERLRQRKDYLRCYRTGRRRHGSLAILYFVPNQLEGPRLGITASRKVGKAVVRQRLKRRIKEIYRRWPHRSQLPAFDLVVHLKPEARGSDFPALRTELLRLFSGLREQRGPAA
jgi:ribonuclease P protein component